MTVPLPSGFRFAGVHGGIKRDAAEPDVVLIVTDQPATAAGVYTQNLVYAAPVALDWSRTPGAGFRAIVANSGNANACTGARGVRDAEEMARLTAAACGAAEEEVLVLSTGIIGEFLPMDRVAAGITAAAARLAGDEAAFLAAARGIMTTDKCEKTARRTVRIAGREHRIAGLAKGAGMIGPRMATLFGIFLTDAPLAPTAAQSLLVRVVDESFNCISVEGHMSTNDTVLLLANGTAGGPPLTGEDLASFEEALRTLAVELATKIPADGEGATHLITIDVTGCPDRAAALAIARTVAHSALVKTAIAGADPNWGRIVSAAGYAGVPFDPSGLSLSINGFLLFDRGSPAAFDAAAVSAAIRERFEAHVALSLREGQAAARFWTSDLTAEYVRINADYHT